MSTPFYVTTPIYYVNDVPHIGHAYTTIAADVIARWHRQNGRDAYFLTGTDEHGQKVHEAATKRGVSPQQHVDELCLPFKALWERLKITHDDFIRTTEHRHTRVVQAALQTLYDSGDIYAADYEGWYSKSEERFWTEKDLVDGKCPMSGNPVEWLKEKNYFFRMAKYADQLREWIADHPDFLQPESRKNEVAGYLKKEVGDLCISRPKSRLPWGIPLPFDDDFVTYVWFDALLNYCSAVGFHPDGSTAEFDKRWPASFHIVGKDILTTHAVYFSTMLFALGQKPADCLFAHGFLTVEGRKMGKSVGNAVDPNLLIDCYGADAVRYFLMREVPFGGDGDFSHHQVMTRYNADLANDLGNLAHRSLSMTAKWLGAQVPPLDADTPRDEALNTLAAKTLSGFRDELEQLHFSVALETLWILVRAGNKYIDEEEPWRLNREGKTERLGGVMRRCLEICRVAAILLAPFCPDKSRELGQKLGLSELDVSSAGRLDGLVEGHPVPPGEPLFPRMTALPERIQQTLAELIPEAAERAAEKAEAKAKKHTKEAPVAEEENAEDKRISIDDFAKVEFKAGLVVGAQAHPNADRLLVLQVDVGEDRPRNIVAGIATKYTPEELVDRQVVIVVNLKPAKLRGVVSEGMLLACGGKEIQALVTFSAPVEPGAVVR